MNYNEFFEQLASNNSRNYKTHLLGVHVYDEILQKIIFMALDPFTNYYIRKIPKYKQLNNGSLDAPYQNLPWALEMLEDIAGRKVTGNSAIEHLKYILSSLDVDDAKVIEKIIKRDLKCGVSAKTVNSVWPGMIIEYPCMLCEQSKEKYINKIKYPVYVQKKEDGGRVNIIVNNGKCEFRSRNGNFIDLLGYYEEDFISMANGENVVFDGEILIDNPETIGADRLTGNGLLNKAIRGTIVAEEVKQFKFVLWDIIPYKHFTKGVYKIPYSERYNLLLSLNLFDKVSIVETFIADNYDSVISYFYKYIMEGFEGVVVKAMDGIWEAKRVQYNIKFKLENTCELRVVDVKYGVDNKYDGLIVSLVCESEDGVIKVDVGSGLKDIMRKTLTEEFIVNKIISSKYAQRIKDKKTGQESLFLARFIDIREDKDTADYAKDIM